MNTRNLILALSALALFVGGFPGSRVWGADSVPATGAAFSYQGRLIEGGVPAQGLFDLRFDLFAENTGGNPLAPTLTLPGVVVSNGLFTTTLDFGLDAFAGVGAWLEIGVRPAGPAGEYITLSPRQSLTPTPYAIYTLKAESLNGPVADAQLSTNVARLDADQIFTGQITFAGQVGIGTSNSMGNLDVQGDVRAGGFSGDGAGLSNVVAAALSARMVERLWRVPIPFVTVTNAGNDPDGETGKGAVAYDFRIGKYEVNNNQYAGFLNAVASDDPHHLYSTNMSVDVHGGIERSGSPGEYTYAVKPGQGHRPVVWVDFHDALRFCNWLHNGQPVGAQDRSSTEDGAYTMTPEGEAANTIARNPQARFWLPNDDEWYKAAYHQPGVDGGDIGNYWLYPTRSLDAPFSELPPGDANSANVCCETDRTSTDVGAYVNAPSYYGTFDQGGNVQEWTEEIIYVTNRRLRGGSWNYNEFYTQSTDFEFDTTDYDGDAIGFRVAGAAKP
jgi:formylglycine-generating enzyme required for sulfatase activity